MNGVQVGCRFLPDSATSSFAVWRFGESQSLQPLSAESSERLREKVNMTLS
jgi:hypothetical protein